MPPTVIVGRGAHAKYLAALTGLARCTWEQLEEIPKTALLIVGVGDVRTRVGWWRGIELDGRMTTGVVLSSMVEGEVADDATVMPGAIIAKSAKVNSNVLVNTGAIIEHDCIVDTHSVIASGAILCGGVVVADQVFVGAGAVICPKVELPPGAFIKAGALIRSNDDAVSKGGIIGSKGEPAPSRRTLVKWWETKWR